MKKNQKQVPASDVPTQSKPTDGEQQSHQDQMSMPESFAHDEHREERLTSHEEGMAIPMVDPMLDVASEPAPTSSRERGPASAGSSYDVSHESQPPAHGQSHAPQQRARHNNNRQDGYREHANHRDQRNNDRGGDQPQRERSNAHRGREHHDGKRHYQQHQQQQGYQQQSHQASSQPQANVPLEEQSLADLNLYARRLGIIGASLMSKDQLIKTIRHIEENPDLEMKVEGVLEKLPDGFGFLRASRFDYVSGPDDVYVSPSQIRRFNLRTGDTVTGVIRKLKEGEKYFALLKVDKVNYKEPMLMADRPNFDRLTPLYPEKKFDLEYNPTVISTRIMDIFTPLGRGQRGLIVAPPKVGKTVLLKELAQAFVANHPDTYLIVLLIDERPEEVADMRRTVKGAFAEVISSTFDESAARHVQVAELVLEKAKRLVEGGDHVIILLDSITRLARAYNAIAPASGKILTGGIDANALQRPKRFFGAARNTEEAGSLTIIASALVDTGSRMDEVIYEEFKGTGNMEMHMTRKLSSRRTYPAFDLMNSGTRRDDLLLPEDDLKKIWVLQKLLSTMSTVEGMEFLIDKMRKTKTNKEFCDAMNKKSGGSDQSDK